MRFIPSLNAAPAGPPRIHLVSPRTRKMCSRSASSKVERLLEKFAEAAFICCFNSDTGISSSGPWERITARSITFCISRMFPGQLYRTRVFMTSVGIVSIRRPIRRAKRWVKWRASIGMSSRRSRKGGSTTGKTFRR